MRLIITRHGETEENRKGITQGQRHGTLSALGKNQAKKLALRLKKEKIDIIYSSDLARAKDTAIHIAKFHQKAKFKFTKQLRERNLGEFEGRKHSEYIIVRKDGTWSYPDPKNGESARQLRLRAKRFWQKLLRTHSSGTVLIVAHGGINKMLLEFLAGENAAIPLKLKNTGVTIIKTGRTGRNKIELVDCTAHL